MRTIPYEFPEVSLFVMPGLGPGIHVLLYGGDKEGVDGRDEPGHDAMRVRRNKPA
jgi:hypothetical protein